MSNGKQNILRASEIGTYLFCKRAWWYQRLGHPSDNMTELTEGSKIHYRHGQRILVSGILRLTSWILLLIAVVIIITNIVQ
jgi:CRISPR/Cas system-associated exonuclease Cas4 (RecB family)